MNAKKHDCEKKTTGMVLGKFMPLHAGHVYLLNFARNYVDELAIVMDSLPDQPIPGDIRYRWLKQMYSDQHVFHLAENNPQEPSEHPDFWQIWETSLKRILPFQLDFVFASEQYGLELAKILGAKFVPVDIKRTAFPISGTEIRENPIANWEYLPPLVRPYFAKRVCIFGPESTGKSTLCQNLARHFNTVFVPEYARTHIESHSNISNWQLSPDDIPMIARGQMAAEDAIAFDTNRVLFCDTDLLTTKIWSEWLFGNCAEWITAESVRRNYDLYLVTDVDVTWVQDQVRYLPEERRSFLARCLDELQRLGRDHTLISGSWEERLATAVRAVETIL